SFVTVEGGTLRQRAAGELDEDGLPSLPEPTLPALAEPYGILVTGVGGTGVVTIGALVGMAAHLEGKGVTVLDMTGLAQKGVAAVGTGAAEFVAATRLATGLLGDAIATNLFMLGYAYQQGLVPVSAEAIDRAIELNGVAVEFNRRAFRWGRRAAVDLALVQAR